MSQLSAKFLKDFWTDEIPSGTVNGVNTVFTLSATPKESDTVSIYINGLFQTPGVDYTISGTTITFTVAPATASSVAASYVKRNGV